MLVLLLSWLGGFVSGVITLPGATMDVTVITEVMACPSEVILQVMELVRVATKMTKRSRVEKNEKEQRPQREEGKCI